jgi:putative NIF3 family GTP cyclohydrolase 1 type 2
MLDEMKGYLDEYLHVADVPDWKDAMNGLQVEGSREVSRVAFAVDACEASIAKAAEWHADLLVVHHGLFWGNKQRLVGAAYRKVALMVQSKMALYSCHTPLDAHEEVGGRPLKALTSGYSRIAPSPWLICAIDLRRC